MKVGLVTAYYDESEKGNEYYLAKELAKEHEVFIYVSKFSVPRYGKMKKVSYGSEITNVVVRRIPSFGLHSKGMIFLKGLKQAIRKDRIDVLHLQEWFMPMGFQLRNEKVVITQRRETFGIVLKLLYLLYGKRLMQNCKAFTCLTTQAKEAIEKKTPFHPRVISNGVDTSFFFPQAKKDNKKFQILYVGRLHYEKGVDLLIEACKQLKFSYQLNIIGSGPEEKKLKELAKDIPATFLGKKQKKDLSLEYSKANVLVVPSRKEPFGFVTLEALSCNTPVVGTRVGGMRDVITSKRGALCAVDANAIANAIMQVKNKEFKNIREGIVNEYDWKVIAKKYLEVYL